MKKIFMVPLICLAIFTFISLNIEATDGIVVENPDERSSEWKGADYITTVKVELTDTVMNKESGESNYWFDTSLLDYSMNDDGYTVTLHFDVMPNSLTLLMSAPILGSTKVTNFNSAYSYMGEKLTSDNLVGIMADLNDIPLIVKSGSVTLGKIEPIVVNKSYVATVTLEDAYVGTRQAKFKLGRDSFVWTVSSHQNWIDNTLSDENMGIVAGRLVLDNVSSDWEYRKSITIDQHVVENENFVNFPMYINITMDNAKTLDNGSDIKFTDSTGLVQLSHEIEAFDGENLIAWVRIPLLYDNRDTIIYVYYGNATPDNQEDIEGVWDDNYVGVWHLKEDPSGAAPQMNDSASENNHGTSANGDSADQVTGQLDGGLDLDGVAEFVTVPTMSGEQGTISAWVNCNTVQDTIFSEADSTIDTGYFLVKVQSQLWFYDEVNQVRGGTVLNAGSWYHTVFTSDGSAWKIYLDGEEEALTIVAGGNSGDWFGDFAGNTWAMGVIPRLSLAHYFNGIMDEVRISNVERSANWIYTAYNIEYDPAGAITLGDEEGPVTYSLDGEWYSTHWELGVFSEIDNIVIHATTDLRGEWDLSANVSTPFGLAYNTLGDLRWFIIDNRRIADNQRIEVYYEDWSYAGSAGTLSGTGVLCTAINNGGSAGMLVGDSSNSEVDNYDPDGWSYLNSIDVSGEMTFIRDIEYMENDDTVRVLSGDAGTGDVYVYNSVGDYTGVHSNLGLPGLPSGFHHDDTSWYVSLGLDLDLIYQYDNNFNPLGSIRSIGADDTTVRDIHVDSENIHMIGTGTDSVYKYSLDNTLDNIYVQINVDLDNDNTIDENGVWHLMHENGHWANPAENTNSAYNYQVGFRVESSNNEFSPRIAGFSLLVDYHLAWISVENWTENLVVTQYEWVSAENWINELQVAEGDTVTPLAPLDDIIIDIFIPLFLLFAPAASFAKKGGAMGFIFGLIIGTIIVYVAFDFSLGIIILIGCAIAVLWFKGNT